jgi:hypothetical protein
VADFIPMFGYSPDRDGTDHFLASLAKPTLAQAGPDLALDETRDVFLGSYLLKCDPGWKRGAQKIGSCVGWGWAMSCDILAACDIHVRSEAEVYGGRVLEASVYAFSRVEVRGQRNLGGDGSYGGAAAKAVTKFGTLHYGLDYGGEKFTDNSGVREKEWGRDGVPDRLEKYAANHKVSSVALVADFEQAAKAIQNGYPVAVCSMQGFSMTLRDGGYLSPMGTWAHCMMFVGVRWKPHPALLCVNSWADCYSGDVDKTLPVQFQRSAGWVRAETCTRMLKGEDSFALSGYSGFAPRKLDGNWLEGIL